MEKQAVRLENTIYHSVLRVGAAVLALVLLFESGLLIDSTASLAQNTHLYLAQSVGMSASVKPNEVNEITAALTEQQQLLDAREAELREREIAVELNQGAVSNDRAMFVIAALLFIMLVLILLNYVLDYLRARPEQNSLQPVQ